MLLVTRTKYKKWLEDNRREKNDNVSVGHFFAHSFAFLPVRRSPRAPFRCLAAAFPRRG